MSALESVELIHQAGGLAVMAHPGLNRTDDIIPDLVKAGLDGIECFHTKHSTVMSERYLEIAEKYHLLVTGGSDCHGFSKKAPLIGTVKLPYEHVEKLYAAKQIRKCRRSPQNRHSIITLMGLFAKFKAGLAKTHAKLTHEIKRIVTRSPKLTAESLEEIEHALIAADLGMAMTTQIVAAVKKAYETQGTAGLDYLAIARAEIEKSLSTNNPKLREIPGGTCVVSIVGVNGTGKTTTSAKLAHYFQAQKKSALLAACDTFRAAAIEQIKLWGARLKVEVIAGRLRRGCGVRGARCRDRRAGAQGGLPVH